MGHSDLPASIDGVDLVEVEIQMTSGVRRVSGYRLAELAVTRTAPAGLWTITHLPSGFNMIAACAIWEAPERAVAAMRAVLGLRNQWADLAGLTEVEFYELGLQVKATCQRFGGDMMIRIDTPDLDGATVDERRPRLNGYAGGLRDA